MRGPRRVNKVAGQEVQPFIPNSLGKIKTLPPGGGESADGWPMAYVRASDGHCGGLRDLSRHWPQVPDTWHPKPETYLLGANLLTMGGKWKEAHMGTMMMTVILSLVALALGMAIFMLVPAVRAYWRARGKRLVTCPENHCAAAVELDAKGAALKAFRGGTYHCLQDCSRWPEKKNCAQDCLSQVEVLGQGCLVRNVVAGWYHGKVCVYCHKPVDNVAEWTGHMPALLTPDSKTMSWADVAPEKLPEIFAIYKPVCWSCHIAETFRREHPELVTDRPARW
jgi:hypothetical protein